MGRGRCLIRTAIRARFQSERIPSEDAAVTMTRFGLMFGFGLEGVNGADNRAVLMDRILDHLLQ